MDEWTPPPTAAVTQRAPGWDLLLVCVAVYIATSIGRVHQLFPILLPLKPALLSAVMAIGLFVLDKGRQRRLALLRSRSTTCLLGLLVWSALSVPAALNQGLAFHASTDFARSGAGARRGLDRDPRRRRPYRQRSVLDADANDHPPPSGLQRDLGSRSPEDLAARYRLHGGEPRVRRRHAQLPGRRGHDFAVGQAPGARHRDPVGSGPQQVCASR